MQVLLYMNDHAMAAINVMSYAFKLDESFADFKLVDIGRHLPNVLAFESLSQALVQGLKWPSKQQCLSESTVEFSLFSAKVFIVLHKQRKFISIKDY